MGILRAKIIVHVIFPFLLLIIFIEDNAYLFKEIVSILGDWVNLVVNA